MTHCILPTDIELAKKLLEASRSDNAIVAALVQRGVQSANAAQLVTDLRSGRQVAPEIPAGLGIAARRRSHTHRSAHRSESEPASNPSEPAPRSERRTHQHEHARKHSSTLWLLAAVPICFAVVIVGMLISKRLHHEPEDSTPNAIQPTAPAQATTPAATQKSPPAVKPGQTAPGKAGPGTAADSPNTPAPRSR
jgi:hypothetical protein